MARTTHYLGVAGVATWFGVAPATVTKWLARYDRWPEPDAMIGTDKGDHTETPPAEHGAAQRTGCHRGCG